MAMLASIPMEIAARPTQAIDVLTLCEQAVAVQAGDFDGDGLEDIAVLATACPGTEARLERLFADGSGGLALAQGHDLQSTFSVLEVVDLDGDGLDDVVLADQGALEVRLAASDHSEPLVSEARPEPFFGVVEEPLKKEDRPRVHLGFGQFDDTPELEIVVRESSGLSIVSLTRGVLHTIDMVATSYAAADLNADGLADVALIEDDRLMVWLSEK